VKCKICQNRIDRESMDTDSRQYQCRQPGLVGSYHWGCFVGFVKYRSELEALRVAVVERITVESLAGSWGYLGDVSFAIDGAAAA